MLPLDEYVFNTEAHAFPLPGSIQDVKLQRAYAEAPHGLDLEQSGYGPEALQQAIDHYRALLPRPAYKHTF